ncbi:MAG: cation:proton antiporter [Aquincola tertiaricarbonis]
MTKAQWFLLLGSLLLLRGVSTTALMRLPVTSAILYLGVGLMLGPAGLGLFSFDPLEEAPLLETLTEVAVLVSLFSAGVKMPVPCTLARWRAPLLLATVSMGVSVGLVAAVGHLLLGLPLGAAVLLGAIIAPTDPVLATDVQLRHPGDTDSTRFMLTSEAGMNDGTAFPFVMLGMGLLGLHELGDHGLRWVAVDLLWATAGGVLIGVLGGAGMARLGWWLRREPRSHELLDDFLGLGLIAVVYGVSVMLHAWGFLAVFFAAVALRQTELRLASRMVGGAACSTPADRPAPDSQEADRLASQEPDPDTAPTVSHGALIFKEHLERLSELTLILLLGGTLAASNWTWPAVGLALFVFLVARPVSVLVGLAGSGMSWRSRCMAGWFGVRGIGSLYYLVYAIVHGLPRPLAEQVMQYTLVVVVLSILLHGTSVKPLISRFWRSGR